MLSKKELNEIRKEIEHGNKDLKIIGNKAYTYDAMSDKWEEIVFQETSYLSMEQFLENTPFYFKGQPKKLNKYFSEIDNEEDDIDNKEKGDQEPDSYRTYSNTD